MHKVAKTATLPRNVAKPSYFSVSWALFMDKISIFIVCLCSLLLFNLLFHS